MNNIFLLEEDGRMGHVYALSMCKKNTAMAGDGHGQMLI